MVASPCNQSGATTLTAAQAIGSEAESFGRVLGATNHPAGFFESLQDKLALGMRPRTATV